MDNMLLSRRDMKIFNTTDFPSILAEKQQKVASLSVEHKTLLISFLDTKKRFRTFEAMTQEANALPDECKAVLEGLVFHEGILQFSLLKALGVNCNLFFERILSALSIA